MVAGLAAVTTGVLMMSRVRTPFFTRNPYLFGDATWGVTYVTHGLAGVGLVGLVIAHVYFAVRPEKWWITKSMLLGWITRRQYLEHHEPERWRVVRTHRRADRERRRDAIVGEALPPAPGDEAMAEFSARCDAIEEAYEFMLAYAAQGLPNEHGSASGSQIRDFLRKCDAALDGLGRCRQLTVSVGWALKSPAPYDAFISVVDHDARNARRRSSSCSRSPQSDRSSWTT